MIYIGILQAVNIHLINGAQKQNKPKTTAQQDDFCEEY